MLTREEIEQLAFGKEYPYLRGLNLSGLNLDGIDLSNADITHACLFNTSLKKATLRGANLDSSDLCHANFTECDLEGCTLSGARIEHTVFSYANMQGVNMEFTSVVKCTRLICDANLSWTKWEGVDFISADFKGANLKWATFNSDEAMNILRVGPGGSRGANLYAVPSSNGVMVYTGCFRGTLKEFIANVEFDHKDTSHEAYYRAVAELISAWAEAYKEETDGN